MSSPATSICVSLQNILLPTDFSACSETALAYGVGLCRRYDATLYMVTVVHEEITDYIQPPDPFSQRHSAENKMANLVNSELFKGIKHYELVTGGSVSEMLSDWIDGLEIDLVVVGTHGRGGIKKFVLGSVAEEIVNCAPCAVLTVGATHLLRMGVGSEAAENSVRDRLAARFSESAYVCTMAGRAGACSPDFASRSQDAH